MRTRLLLLLWQTIDPHAEGIKALESKQYERAAELFTQAVKAAPAEYGAHFHLALALGLGGKDQEAITAYRKVLEMKPDLYEAELNLGILLIGQKQARDAIVLLESAVRKKSKEFRPAYYLAESRLAAGLNDEAAGAFRAAIALDSKSAAAHLGLARALSAQNQLAEAAPEFERAAELDPGYRDSLLELASLFERSGETDAAVAVYMKFPDNPAARERAGALLIGGGKPDAAIVHLTVSVEKAPTAANRYLLATAFLRLKQPDKARPQLEQAVALEPENHELRMALARTMRDLRDFASAAREFARVAREKPDHKEAWSELAGMLILTENYQQALTAMDRLEQLGGQTAAQHYFRAILLDRLKQTKPALESYTKFLALSQNQHPDEEFKARQRVRVLQKELSRK